MSNIRLALTSIIIILVLAGIPHLVNSYSKKQTPPVQSSLIGQWKVEYKSDDFSGSAVIEIRKKNNELTGYIIRYMDEYGQTESTLEDRLFITDSNTSYWEGYYAPYFEDEDTLPCSIQLISNKQLRLNYNYHGYIQTEIWNKIN